MIFDAFGGHKLGEGQSWADVVIILVASFKLLHMSSQMRVDKTYGCIVYLHPDAHTTFIALWKHVSTEGSIQPAT